MADTKVMTTTEVMMRDKAFQQAFEALNKNVGSEHLDDLFKKQLVNVAQINKISLGRYADLIIIDDVDERPTYSILRVAEGNVQFNDGSSRYWQLGIFTNPTGTMTLRIKSNATNKSD